MQKQRYYTQRTSREGNFIYEEDYNLVSSLQPLPQELTTHEALDMAIEKWEFVLGLLVDSHLVDSHPNEPPSDGGVTSCPLCSKFYFKHHCAGCPVHEYTGQPQCCDTPYSEWLWVDQRRFKDNVTMGRVIAAKEIEFLKDVRAWWRAEGEQQHEAEKAAQGS